MTRKDFEAVAKIVAMLSFSLKDRCFIIGDSQSHDALMDEELHTMIDDMLKNRNENYNDGRFWKYVYNYRQKIIDIINNN